MHTSQETNQSLDYSGTTKFHRTWKYWAKEIILDLKLLFLRMGLWLPLLCRRGRRKVSGFVFSSDQDSTSVQNFWAIISRSYSIRLTYIRLPGFKGERFRESQRVVVGMVVMVFVEIMRRGKMAASDGQQSIHERKDQIHRGGWWITRRKWGS